jgi:hypothetical protein
VSDKRHVANPKRAFPTWIGAVRQAAIYGWQTGRKFQVYAVGDAFRIRRTDKRYTSHLLPVDSHRRSVRGS